MTGRMVLLLIPVLAAAQPALVSNNAETKPDSSVSGVVLAAGSDLPMTDATVYVNRGSRDERSAKTDSQGHYELRGLPPGYLRLTASAPFEGRPFGPTASRQVTVAGGQTLTSIDFHLPVFAQLSGHVLDENKEPMPGISVILVAREYSLGAIRYVYSRAATTNDLGEYKIGRIEAGRAFLAMAQKRQLRLPAISDTPADPRYRRHVPVTTWYPSSTDMQGAQPIMLRPGEQRDAVDIQMGRSPSYCMEGILEANGRPGALSFNLDDASPTSGASGDGAMFMAGRFGVTAEDGKFRFCDLQPGSYTLTAYPAPLGGEAPALFGSARVTITDEDVRGVKVVPRPRLNVPGEVAFEGTPPDKPIEGKLNLNLSPMTRAPFGGEFKAMSVKADIPGTFVFEGLLLDDYSIRVNQLPESLYIREMTYGGRSVLYEPLRVGTALGDAGMRVTIGLDGGFVSARVSDSKGNPVSNSWVCVLPDHIPSEAMLAAALVAGQTDQTGTWKSKALAPGKYFVLAASEAMNRSPEDIGKLWQARTHAQEVQVSAGATASVSVILSIME